MQSLSKAEAKVLSKPSLPRGTLSTTFFKAQNFRDFRGSAAAKPGAEVELVSSLKLSEMKNTEGTGMSPPPEEEVQMAMIDPKQFSETKICFP